MSRPCSALGNGVAKIVEAKMSERRPANFMFSRELAIVQGDEANSQLNVLGFYLKN